jgi:hypothetical protein
MTDLKAIVKATVLGATVLLLGLGMARAQVTTVSLVAAPTTVTLPDGSTVPMWGYFCVDVDDDADVVACSDHYSLDKPDRRRLVRQSHESALVSGLRHKGSHLAHDRGTARRRPGSSHVKLRQYLQLDDRLDVHAEPGSLQSPAGHVAHREQRADKRASAAGATSAIVQH